jgi:hypothetical protein
MPQIDPEGTNERNAHRLSQQRYVSKRTYFVWHVKVTTSLSHLDFVSKERSTGTVDAFYVLKYAPFYYNYLNISLCYITI